MTAEILPEREPGVRDRTYRLRYALRGVAFTDAQQAAIHRFAFPDDDTADIIIQLIEAARQAECLATINHTKGRMYRGAVPLEEVVRVER